jgi:hypothetical protein
MSMGLPDNKIEGSIRLSLGDMTTQEDIDQFKVKFETIYKEIKELLKSIVCKDLMTLSFKAFTNFFRFVPFKVSSPYLTNKH